MKVFDAVSVFAASRAMLNTHEHGNQVKDARHEQHQLEAV
jgi:hypothetical protein